MMLLVLGSGQRSTVVKGVGSEVDMLGASDPCPATQSLRELGHPLNLSLALKRGLQWHLLPRSVVGIRLRTVPAHGKHSDK